MSDPGNEARRHHWVPQCYLKGFTSNRDKTSHLFVVDGKTKKSFRAPPSKVAAGRDFNRIDIDGQHPNAIEAAFSLFETRVNDALERIEANTNLSHKDDHVLVLNLISMLAVRNPRMRETMRDARERQAEVVMDALLSSRERWSASITKASAAGYVEVQDGKDVYDQMRDFVARGDYEIEVPTTEHVVNELQLFDEILPYLVARKWSLFVADANSGGFITCDHPVILKWDGTQEREPRWPPGYAQRGTEVVFPLSRKLAMCGMFDGEEGAGVIPAKMVALINGLIIANAGRQIYACDDQFRYFLNHSMGTRVGVDLVTDLIAEANNTDTPG